MAKEGSVDQFREREEESGANTASQEGEGATGVSQRDRKRAVGVRNRTRNVDTHLAQTHPYSLSTLTRTSFQKNKLLFKYDITFKGSGVIGHRSLLSVEFLRHRYFSKRSQKKQRISVLLTWLFSVSCFALVISVTLTFYCSMTYLKKCEQAICGQLDEFSDIAYT